MSIAIGGNSASKVYLGSTEVSKMYLGSDLVYGSGAVDGHQIAQIRMPIGSYLNTGYNPNNNTRVECGMIPLSKSRWGALFIGRTPDVNTFGLQYYEGVEKLWHDADVGSHIHDDIAMNLIPLYHYDIAFTQQMIDVNGSIFNFSKSSVFQCGNPMTINAFDDGSLACDTIFDYFKIYDSGVLVRNYVPWQRSNGDVGMLDRVNRVFYQSDGSVQFTTDAIILPEGYTRLNYISATGTQRFTTDFTPTQKDNYEVRCRFVGNNAYKTILSSRYSTSSRRYELMSGATNSPNTELYFGYRSGSSNNTGITNYENKNICAIKAENRIYYYIEGTYSFGNSGTYGTFTCPKPLTIGCSNTNGTYANWFVGDIIELDFFGNAHYIPCISSNNEVGMYDVMNGVFKASETSTPFIAGTIYGQ